MGMNHPGNSVMRKLFTAVRKSKGSENLCIRLEYNRKVLYETSNFTATDTITIGRSSDCTWIIPKEDHVASGHHAVILMRQGRICLRDTGSRNGIFYRTRKIQEKNLAPDDQFTIGSCTLLVERIRNTQSSPHELVYLNTALKGQSVKLGKSQMTAGSAPGCDLVIDEQLISQKHAEFCSKADGCWLKDLGSKNGTFVNGTKLSPNTERLLVDDDVISMAFVDFRFVDGKIEHSKVRIWHSLGVVGVVILVVMTLNWVWMTLKSSSDACIGFARREAAAQRFSRAREYLRESRTRRGAESNQIACNELERSISIWEKIYSGWFNAKSALAAGNWVEASHILGMITDADPNIWGWNDTSAPEMREEAFAAKKLLDAYLLAETSIRDDRNRKNIAELKKSVSFIENFGRKYKGSSPPYLKKLLTDSLLLGRQISANLLYLGKLQDILARIESESDNLAMVLNDLTELKQHAEPNIRIRIENCMVPLSMLHRSEKQIKRAILAVQQLDFANLNSIKLDLPPLEQCAVNENIATLRKKQERQFLFVRSVASNLQPLIHGLKEAGLEKSSVLPDCVVLFRNRQVMKKVFACDALDRKMPSRLRTEPAGEYDRVLGIEGFFEFIYALPAPYDQSIYAEFQFRPEIIKFRNLLTAVRNFRNFADQSDNRWFRSGEVERLYAGTGRILEFRDRLAKDYSVGKSATPRERILRKAIVIFLSPGEVREAELENFSRELKKMRTPLIRLGRDYNTASDERRIRIRDEILSLGIPGDPVVRRMWGFKHYAR